jgi:hypothetical protein
MFDVFEECIAKVAISGIALCASFIIIKMVDDYYS